MLKLLKSSLAVSCLALSCIAGPGSAGAAEPSASAPAEAGGQASAASPNVQELARKVEIVTRTKGLTAVPENEPQPIDLSLVRVPGAPANLTEGVTANAYSRYVKVDGQLVGQLVLSSVQKDGKVEALNTENFVAQFTLERPELDAASVINVEGNGDELIAALERLAEKDEEAEERETAEAANAASGAPSNAAENKDAAGYQNPAPLDVEPASIPNIRVTNEGCQIRVDLTQQVAIQQARVETEEEGRVTYSECEDGNDRFPLQKSYAVCGDKVDIEARLAQAQYLLFYTDAGGNRQEVSDCAPDEEQLFPITEKRGACTVYLDYANEEAVPQAALTYLNASNTEVQVRGCEPSLEAAAVPLLRSVEGCTIRHDFAASRSFRQSRYTYELGGAIWQAGPCSDDGTEYAHRQVYETTGGALVCEPIVSRDLGTVTHQSRIQIDLESGSEFITECKPDSSANALIATVEGCTNPASWTHDVSAGVSYGQERFYYERSGTRTFVTECVNSETVYNHQQTISGWQNHDGQLYAYRLTTLSIDTPQGPYTVLASEVLPGAEEEPYIYEGLTTKLDGTGWYEGCTEYAGQDSVKLYRRPDGTSYEVVVGDAAPVNKGNKCTVSTESRTVYAYTEWTGGEEDPFGYYLGAGCGSHPTHCPWQSYFGHLPPSHQVTGLSSYNNCVTLGQGITMTHYDRRQSRQVTQFPDGNRQFGSWANEGSPYVRVAKSCIGIGIVN